MGATEDDYDSIPLTVQAASQKLDQLFRTNRWQKVINVVAAVAVIIALATSAFLVKSHYELKADESQLQNNAVASCQNGNSFRSGQTEIWNSYYAMQAAESKATAVLLVDLVDVIAQHSPVVVSQIDSIMKQSNVAASAEQKSFLAKVASVNKTRDCVADNSTPTTANAGS